ncbi:MAG TPA: tetratricopeptide repeat protein, partial [Albitalea sp.]|uniref:tetratricopeptide repeat protein n=1 Tax=Piscinibacter sp. TaxID=1903157 RepID=UPI002ED46072
MAYLFVVLLLIFSAGSAAAVDEDARWKHYRDLQKYDPAGMIEKARLDIAKARAAADEHAELDALLRLSLGYATVDETSQQEENERRGEELAIKLGDTSAQCWYVDGRAWVMWGQGKWTEAGALWDEAAAMATRLGLKRVLASIYTNRGQAHQVAERRAEALQWLSKGYHLYEEINDNDGMARALLYIGAVYGGPMAPAHDQLRASEHLERGLALVDMKRDRRLAVDFVLRMALTLTRRNEIAKARPWFTQALSLTRQLRLPHLEAIAEFHVGVAEMADKRPQEALAHLYRARAIFQTVKDPSFQPRVLVTLGLLLAQQGRREEALAILAEAQPALAAVGTAENEAYYLPRAAEAHAALGNYAEAYRLVQGARDAERRRTEAQNSQLAEELR